MASKTQSKLSPRGWTMLVSVLVILLAAFVIFLSLRKKKKQQTEEEEEHVRPEEAITPESKIKDFYNLVKDVYTDEMISRYITAQAMHETGIFKSDLFVNQNNAFGMKHPVNRDTKDIGSENEYAAFNSVEDSIEDLLLWMDYVKFNMNVDSIQKYAQELKDHAYFTASYTNYLGALKRHELVVNVLV